MLNVRLKQTIDSRLKKKSHKELFKFIGGIEIIPTMLFEKVFAKKHFDERLELICDEFEINLF